MNKEKWKKIIGIMAATMGTTFVVTSIIAKKKKGSSQYEDESDQLNPLEGKKVVFIENDEEIENADGVRGHLEAIGNSDYRPGFYEKYVKRGFDIVLSFGGLVVLSPVLAAIAIAIKIDDPGPVLFTQKRMGQNKKYFKLHKFRSMKMCTPHDVPTHQLENPEQYITRVGKFLRSHSLDELPQIWDIFIGNMSVIGPRPGLWNQDVLTAERDKYNANDVKPGLTGWAQINGRDELEIPVKAKLDGEYVKHMGPVMDLKCFLGSVGVFAGDESVVEGGTGEIKKNHVLPEIATFKSDISFEEIKKILIAGAGSYIGESFKNYMLEFDNYIVDTLSTMDDSWKAMDFSSYDAVYDVAGIAHVRESNENRDLYYKVNRDLAVDLAEKAKKEGVKQFVYLSSMSVYGRAVGRINATTSVNPTNAYGKSKIEAEELLWRLKDDNFTVSIVRPPMVYGEGCKGNYQTLKKFALKFGFFPDYNNERSMIHVDNLSGAIRGIIHNNESGLYFPQDPEYIKTFDMVKKIAEENGKKFRSTKLMNIPIKFMSSRISVFKKVFGTLTYDKGLNVPEEWGKRMKKVGSIAKCHSALREKKVLIMMSTYNGEKYIRAQIESILAQKTEAEFFLRIRDDGSKDGTCKIIEDIIKENPKKIELIKGENKGYNASFFELINMAEDYDYYAISDQDDIWLENKIQSALKMLSEVDADVPALYASTSFLVHDDLKPFGSTRKKRREFTIYNTIVQNICPGHSQVLNNALLRIIKENIEISNIYVYDSWITNYAMLYGTILFDNNSHTLYRQHSGNQLGSGKNAIGQMLSSLKKINNGDGNKYRNQIVYFTQLNQEKLKSKGYYEELYKLGNMKTVFDRISYCLSGKVYRQTKLETIALKMAILLGKY